MELHPDLISLKGQMPHLDLRVSEGVIFFHLRSTRLAARSPILDFGEPSSHHTYSMQDGDTPMANPDEPVRVIWGTNVSIAEAQSTFREFILGFKEKYRIRADQGSIEPGEGENLVYVNMLNQMRVLGLSNLNLDVRNLDAYPPAKKLYYQLINYPQEIIPIMDQTVKDCMVSLATENGNISHETIEMEIESRIYKVLTIRPG